MLEQVHQTRLLGVIIDDRLSWQANTDFLIKKAYKRMSLFHRLYEFDVPVQDLIEIYILYIRSVLESSAVVWNSSLTKGQELELERVQKVALRIILKDDYENYKSAPFFMLTSYPKRTAKCTLFIFCKKVHKK